MAMAMTLQQIQWQLRHYKLSSAANYARTVLRQKNSMLNYTNCPLLGIEVRLTALPSSPTVGFQSAASYRTHTDAKKDWSLRSVGLKISMETKGRRDRNDRLQYSTFLPMRSTISHFGYNLPSNRRISLALTTKLSRREKIHNTYLLTCYTTVDSFKT